MVVPLREYAFVIVVSVVLSLIVLSALWPWTRQPRTMIAIALSMAVGIIIWNTALNLTNAESLNVDSAFLRLSVQDLGSGVGAFIVTLLALRFITERAEPLTRILAASGVVGLLTIAVDLFG